MKVKNVMRRLVRTGPLTPAILLILAGCMGASNHHDALQSVVEDAVGADVDLIAIFGLEYASQSHAQRWGGCGAIPVTESFGEGSPSLWAYAYVYDAPEGSGLLWKKATAITDAAGNLKCVLGHEESDQTLPPLPGQWFVLSDWNIDAKKATQTLATEDQDFRAVREHCPVTSELVAYGKKALWLFAAYDFRDDSPRTWIVNAMTGKTVEAPLERWPTSRCQVPVESGESSGKTGIGRPLPSDDPVRIEMEYNHRYLRLQVESNDPAAADVTFRVHVQHPDGDQTREQVRNGQEVRIRNAAQGAYVIDVGAATVGSHEFTLLWCADDDASCRLG